MYALLETADDILSNVVVAAGSGEDALIAALEALPAPLYVTDAEGIVTHYNQACIGFTGRTPAVGKDQWCVTWKLYTDAGEFLPHSECPMALAIRTRRPIRGLSATAERPDGTRVHFVPFPTPLFSPSGEFVGAVNMLIDVTDIRQTAELESQAKKCRRLADFAGDRRASEILYAMAAEYEKKAHDLEQAIRSRLSSE
jgi:PAS domain S-box-containing protein